MKWRKYHESIVSFIIISFVEQNFNTVQSMEQKHKTLDISNDTTREDRYKWFNVSLWHYSVTLKLRKPSIESIAISIGEIGLFILALGLFERIKTLADIYSFSPSKRNILQKVL